MSGQTLVAKTIGHTVDKAVIVESRAVAATVGPAAQKRAASRPARAARRWPCSAAS